MKSKIKSPEIITGVYKDKNTEFVDAEDIGYINNETGQVLIKINQETDKSLTFENNNTFLVLLKYQCKRCARLFYPSVRYDGKMTRQKQCPLCKSPYWDKEKVLFASKLEKVKNNYNNKNRK